MAAPHFRQHNHFYISVTLQTKPKSNNHAEPEDGNVAETENYIVHILCSSKHSPIYNKAENARIRSAGEAPFC